MTDEGPLTVRATIEGAVARVTLYGELDLDRAAAVADELSGLPRRGANHVVVDVRELSFIDSSGLRALLSARELLGRENATIELTNLSPAVERVLEMTGTRALLTHD